MSKPLKQAQRQRPLQAGKTREAAPTKVRVIYGVHAIEAGVAGRSVGDVRATLQEALSISSQAVALVNGRQATEAHLLQAGETLEFVRVAGEKGTRGTPFGSPRRATQIARRLGPEASPRPRGRPQKGPESSMSLFPQI